MTLATDALEVRYGREVAVRPTSVTLAPGELIGLIGPNGAGKTSLLRALAGVPVARSDVAWQGRPLDRYAPAARARALAYLPQSPQANWPLSVGELVALGRLPHRRFGEALQADDLQAIDAAMRETEVTALASRPMDRLSGGERMRAHLARAFAVDAPALLVDEPTASLDPYHQLSVMRLLRRYRDSGRLVVAVLHDLNLALGSCSRLILMDRGEVVADGDPRDVVNETRLARHYRIRAWLAESDGRRIAVPWEMLQAND
jgi:iron complex transport system ATP-binding protein